MTITTRELTVRFPGTARAALHEIDMTIPKGSFTVFVGASGSGKSTLLHSLAGLQTPTSGVVLDNDEQVTGPDPRRGMAFQRDVLFPWMTVADNIEFALIAGGVPRPARGRRIAELLDVVGLSPEVSRQRPAELSGGMRQRAGIARMLAADPDVLLMDEPFAALDALTRLRMQDLILDLWGQTGRTVVFVTHDVDEAVRLADTIVVLQRGRIVERIDNPVPRPRPADVLADLPGYPDTRRTLHQLLGVADHV
ncbi:ABC transporter ATP-binding protein [Gordonia sp. PDNC005]|uniref:ABC transporter ATP-binding protein n=1 Tax=unclassified Gordonia (in: high G+C Gram-positive bacteria) TaxID=2657482 RepID=UPI001964AC15|nr:ABC transporter ATP-binding protein [Gordonia sp. PDNC005]QRY62623.1 ABC transporter ATP-binding protein [Gordonia sp. PDNC005]